MVIDGVHRVWATQSFEIETFALNLYMLAIYRNGGCQRGDEIDKA